MKLGVPDGGEKLAFAPDGRSLADKFTVSLKPPTEVSETVATTDSPWTTDPELGFTLMVKSGWRTCPDMKRWGVVNFSSS